MKAYLWATMKGLIKIGLLLVVGILGYNYFFGTEEEKATSEKVFKQVKQVGKSIGDLVKNERQKFADGKYDKAFDKLGSVYKDAKEKLSKNADSAQQKELDDLEKRKRELEREKEKLEKELESDEASEETLEESQTLEKEIGELMEESKDFLKRILKEK